MSIQFLVDLTPSPDIYHGCCTRKTLWEEKFTLANITGCGRCSVRKHREINNGYQYISSYIYLELYCLDKSEVVSSESSYYMGVSGKGLTTYMNLRGEVQLINKSNDYHYWHY